MTDAANTGREALVPPGMAGQRLDKAISLLWPEVGLRGRRRLLEAGGVTVDGRRRGAAYRVRAGEKLAALGLLGAPEAFFAGDVPILFRGEAYAALAKPAGLHSAAIAQGGGQSLESLLPALFPDAPAWLLSRLDRLTSGILPVALTEAAAAAYRQAEAAGRVEKTYLCVAHGSVTAPLTVEYALDVADRARTLLLRRTDPDRLRHTALTPLEALPGLTLLACRIAKGARHQIRAHLAGIGHPLVGDPVYGHGEGERLYLHCAGLVAPGLDVTNPPPWTLAGAMAAVSGAQTRRGAK
ncbi:MAG: pseudouridine synthase [Solidesulfovibrio sp. DCME]|uniref:pseudouridine synthase n=1 Tax=Solidesulfovibrio sp. DCME TaxID=3447380 RepID=UPI003D14BDA2